MAPNPTQKALDLDDKMKWWSTYEPLHYTYRARPFRTFKSYVRDVFAPLEQMQRSATAVRFTYQHDTEPSYAASRSKVSLLSPSHALPPTDRRADRYVPLVRSYKPKADSWRREYEFQLKHPVHTYTKPMKVPSGPVTPRDIFDEFFAYKRYQAPSRIYRPISYTRWQYGGAYSSGKLRGSDVIGPYRYTNYDRNDDRAYMRTYFPVRSYGVPYPYRQYMRLYENYDPKRILITQ